MEQSNEALVAACRRGDETAWEMLVERYQRLVYSIPRRAGLDAEQAAEVFQQVFATLVEQLPTLQQPDRINAWLATTARRESWRVSQRARRQQPLPQTGDDNDGDAELPDPAALPDEVVLRLEQQQHVYQAVQSLDERCRTLLTMLFYRREPPPYAEIAAALGTNEGSIGPTRARCLEKLRRGLRDV